MNTFIIIPYDNSPTWRSFGELMAPEYIFRVVKSQSKEKLIQDIKEKVGKQTNYQIFELVHEYP